MHQNIPLLRAITLILFFSLLAGCGAPTVETPAGVDLPPTQSAQAAPESTATSLTSPPAAPSPTPIPWQAPENWWQEMQNSGVTQPLFGTYILPEEAPLRDDYYDVYAKYGVTLATWNCTTWHGPWRDTYQQTVDDLHERGYIAVGTDSTFNILQEGNIHADKLKEAFIVDPFGNPLTQNACAPPEICEATVLSTLHPDFWKEKLSIVKFFIDAGVDGILIDELAKGSVYEMDFNPHTVAAFRQYLLDTYSPEELQKIGKEYGISDFASLDYAVLVRQHLPPGQQRLTRDEDWEVLSKIPLWSDYERYKRAKHLEFARRLVQEGKAYAMEKYGREMPFSANIFNTTGPEFNAMIDDLDYVDMEFSYQNFGYFPAGRASTAVHFVHAFGKPAYLITGIADTDWDIIQRGTERSTNLLRLMIADAAASGARFQVEEGFHGIKQDMQALAPYYRLPVDSPYLFKDMAPVKGDAGLLFLWEYPDMWNYTDFRGLGSLLSDSGYQYSVIFGAEEFTWWGTLNTVPAPDHPLKLSDLEPYPVIILPEMGDITPNHAEILLQYARQGGKVVIFTTPDHINNLTYHRGQSNPIVAELLGYMQSESADVEKGKIITIKELWGIPYTENPVPGMRQPLADLLGKESVLPQVSMGEANYVSAFMHQAPESLAVHFVNYDYDPETDKMAPVGPLQVEVMLPEGFPRDDISVYFVTPGGETIKLDTQTGEDRLQLTLPGIEVWSILWIGNENALQAVMAKNPTPTPLPAPTATPSAQQLAEGGYIIYGDGLSEGWRAAANDVKLFLASTEEPYQGGQAIALSSEGWGWLDLSYREAVDTGGFNSLVMHVNPGETENLEFSVTIFNNEQSVNYVFLSAFLEGQPLEKNGWRRVVIPLSDLNPEGAPFNRIFFQNESDNPASFSLDEIFFAAQE